MSHALKGGSLPADFIEENVHMGTDLSPQNTSELQSSFWVLYTISLKESLKYCIDISFRTT